MSCEGVLRARFNTHSISRFRSYFYCLCLALMHVLFSSWIALLCNKGESLMSFFFFFFFLAFFMCDLTDFPSLTILHQRCGSINDGMHFFFLMQGEGTLFASDTQELLENQVLLLPFCLISFLFFFSVFPKYTSFCLSYFLSHSEIFGSRVLNFILFIL